MTNINRTAHRVATGIGTLSIAAAGVALAAAPAQAAQWQLHQLDGDRCYDMATLDLDYNGYANDIWMDLDNDCRWDTRQWNTHGHDSFHERMTFDRNEDGSVNALLMDTDQRVGFEYVRFDRNDDGNWDGPVRSYNTSYSVVTDMALSAVRLGPGQWVYNPYV